MSGHSPGDYTDGGTPPCASSEAGVSALTNQFTLFPSEFGTQDGFYPVNGRQHAIALIVAAKYGREGDNDDGGGKPTPLWQPLDYHGFPL